MSLSRRMFGASLAGVFAACAVPAMARVKELFDRPPIHLKQRQVAYAAGEHPETEFPPADAGLHQSPPLLVQPVSGYQFVVCHILSMHRPDPHVHRETYLLGIFIFSIDK